MPFEIVRNDITNMQADAVVNTANPEPIIGSGVDSEIHRKAGHKLLLARQKIGSISFGDAAVTPAYGLDAKYVIHTVGPVWTDGNQGEEQILSSCYRNSLALAKKHRCKSIAFPLIATGNYGFPKPLALQIAIREISSFLLENEMQIYLVVFDRTSFELSEKLFNSVSSYIDENYIDSKPFTEYFAAATLSPETRRKKDRQKLKRTFQEDAHSTKTMGAFFNHGKDADGDCPKPWHGRLGNQANSTPPPMPAAVPTDNEGWNNLLKNLDAGFSETLLKLIDRTGKKDSEIYKKANVDRKLFSKIRNNMDYKPSKTTALAFAFALELDLDEAKDFIGRAGFALSHSSKFDVIVEYFLVNGNYDVFELNQVLFAFDQPLIGA